MLTKQEAIAAMKAGKKVTHRFFTKEEWITIYHGRILAEDGCSVTIDDFFMNRNGKNWETGYELFILQ